jgi:hypothetical protein
MKKIVTYNIEFCNSDCPHFYHKYEDHENCWCVKLNKKIFDFNVDDHIDSIGDCTERAFPEECPLPDA